MKSLPAPLCACVIAAVMVVSTSAASTRPEDISQINDLEVPPINLDPRLRRALLRVLTKLEEEDRRHGQARQVAEDMQNIINEDQFIKYFQERGLEKELFNGIDKEAPKEDPNTNPQEILSYSADEINSPDKPFTFASYPKDKEPQVTPNSLQDSKNEIKYPSTNPTPPLDNAIYFQIPEPVHIPDSDEINEEEEMPSNNQDTRSIQGPTLLAPVENEYQQDNQEVLEVEEEKEEQEGTQEEPKVSFVRVNVPKEGVRDADDGEEKTEVDFQASNGTEVVVGNSTKKEEKHEVEFLTSPLLAAFTVQQDQQGLPRRVIPLNYRESGEPIPLPDNKQILQEQSYQRLRQAQREILFQTQLKELERQRQFQQQHNFQQNQQLQQNQLIQHFQHQQNQPTTQGVHFQKSVDFQFQQPFTQPQQFQSPSSSFEVNNINSFQPSDFGRVNRHESSNFGISTPRPSASFPSQSFVQPSQSSNFLQNSFRSTELNRVNRHEPSNFIGNFGLSTPSPSLNFPAQSFAQPSNFLQTNYQHRFAPQRPVTLDNQLQNLFSITGIAGGRVNAQEDLNIVSKVLALGHDERHLYQNQQSQNQQFQSQQFQNQQFQASTRHEQVVKAPARVIQPPKL